MTKRFEIEFDDNFDEWLAKHDQKNKPPQQEQDNKDQTEKLLEAYHNSGLDKVVEKAQQEHNSKRQTEKKFKITIDDDFDGWFANNTQNDQTTITAKTETVFISYSSIEQRTAEEIKQKLESCRISCWMAPKSIPAGSDYGTEIPKAIKKCKIFLLILSKNSQNSKWVPKELDMAIKHDLKVIPLQIDDSAINDRFEFSLINCQRIIAYKRKNAAFKELKEAILTEFRNS